MEMWKKNYVYKYNFHRVYNRFASEACKKFWVSGSFKVIFATFLDTLNKSFFLGPTHLFLKSEKAQKI